MNILLYNPDNEITNNFMPHLWMFLLKSLTPPGHKVFLVDGNAKRLSRRQLVEFIRAKNIDLVGIGAMTRMIRKAYWMADAVRAAGVPVVMGGPHVTEVPDEPLGRDGEPRHADAVALGEDDHTWPQIVADAARGALTEIYAPLGADGQEVKPSLADYPVIPWDRMDLDQFNLIRHFPKMTRRLLSLFGMTWQTFHMIPIESGRGCPYGCEFCTVTGFFGDSIRFRSNESVVDELLMLKALEKRQKGKIAVFFIDDNFAINPRRTKSLLREIIARDAQVPWVAQISMNLLRDEELVSLIAQSGGRWIFMGLESIDPENLKSVRKGFNKPEEYKTILERLARHNLYAITSFIFGMDSDRPGVAQRTLEVVRFLAAGASRVRVADTVPGNSPLRPFAFIRPAHTAETLAGVQALHDGLHASEDYRRPSGGGGSTRMGNVLQSQNDCLRRPVAGIEVLRRPPHPSARPFGIPGNLFSADEAPGMGAGPSSKPKSHPPPACAGTGTEVQAAAARTLLSRPGTAGRADRLRN